MKKEPIRPSQPLTVAFVSGKGGVGKTVLASNFAWVSSLVARTVLIDLDFQNQGLTGLFAPQVEFSRANALGALEQLDDTGLQEPVETVEGVAFLPSVSWEQATSQDAIDQLIHKPDFQKRLAALIESFHSNGFEIIIVDCHGGVDPVSLAAFETCSHTLMVTEADSVTFNGTLALLDYYQSAGLPNSHRDSASTTSPANQPRLQREGSGHFPDVRFVVNRLPSKYRWRDLERVYGRFMDKALGTFSSDRSIFCYIPVEAALAESFGEYPFFVKLMPNSIFARKVQFMVYSLIQGRFNLPSKSSKYKLLAKFSKPKYRRKVQRTVVSYEHKNIESILKFYAWFSTLYTIAVIGALAVGAGMVAYEAARPQTQNELETILAKYGGVLGPVSIIIAVVLGVPILWYSLRSMFGLMFVYRDRHRFQKALFRAVSPSLSLWQRLSLVKLLMLRVGTSILPVLVVLYFAFLIISLPFILL